MKLHIVNFRLQMLLSSMSNPVENSDSPHSNGKKVTSRTIRASKSPH